MASETIGDGYLVLKGIEGAKVPKVGDIVAAKATIIVIRDESFILTNGKFIDSVTQLFEEVSNGM
jgi:hypothetical protein